MHTGGEILYNANEVEPHLALELIERLLRLALASPPNATEDSEAALALQREHGAVTSMLARSSCVPWKLLPNTFRHCEGHPAESRVVTVVARMSISVSCSWLW